MLHARRARVDYRKKIQHLSEKCRARREFMAALEPAGSVELWHWPHALARVSYMCDWLCGTQWARTMRAPVYRG